MIVTTGKHIKVELLSGLKLELTAERPGAVVVYGRPGCNERVELPAAKDDAEAFIAAYRRIIAEDVAYRKTEVE